MDIKEPSSNDELISWNFEERSTKQRGNTWYVLYGIIIAGLIIYSVFADNFLFAVILILFSLIVFLQNWHKPEHFHFAVTPQGIHVGKTYYRMSDLDEFWIAYQPPNVKMIFIDFQSSWRPTMGIPLEDQNPLQVREILLEFLPENLDKEDEPLPDTLARLLNL